MWHVCVCVVVCVSMNGKCNIERALSASKEHIEDTQRAHEVIHHL